MKALSIAMICHGINAAYCQSLGDNSQPTWEDAPEWQKQSAIVGVEMHLANPDATPEQSHQSWYKQKEAEGWKYGEVKDPELKEHPCFLPYEELPQEQKAKDYLFRAVVHLVKDLPEQADHNALLTQLMTAQTQIKQYQATLASGSGAAAAAPVQAQGVTVVYESFKSEYTDRMYGSNVTFVHGQPKTVPAWLAEKLLKHPEFKRHKPLFSERNGYKPSEVVTAEIKNSEVTAAASAINEPSNEPSNETLETIENAKKETEAKENEENAVFDAKQTVSQINDKDSLAEYAMKTFNQKIPKNQSIDWMKNKINELIDQQGLPE